MKAPRSVSFVAPRGSWLFGQHAHRGPHRLAAACLALAALAVLSTGGVWFELRSRLATREEMRLDAEQLARRAQVASTAAAAPAAVNAAERVRINRIVRRLNTPWSAIFTSLESQALPGVAVLSLEPDVERGAVRVHTEGPSLDELLRHAASIQEMPQFGRTQLLRIDPEEGKGAAGLSRLSFDLILTR
ncbi:hypothetical protein ACVNIS_10640 [Sphaerotilaceae bacterium SBD11-9]